MGRRIDDDWARDHVAALARGETVRFRPVGGSMRPLIESGDLVEVRPLAEADSLVVGTIVLARVERFTYVHLIKDTNWDGGVRYLIGNNRGRTNGWVFRGAIYGIVRRVEA